MLLGLKIENYALIRQLDVRFDNGFTVITGETGAGKSIILGALALVLGSRADVNVLFDKKEKCIVEAEFSIDITTSKMFENNGLDFDKNSIFRREINSSGKSRAFINDTPVQLNIMREIGERIMNIHSQNSSNSLKETEFQYRIIDSFIEDKSILNKYRDEFGKWTSMSQEIKSLEIKNSEKNNEKNYFEFLSQEFDKIKLRIGEKEELENELELITNSEEIKYNIVSALNILDPEIDNQGIIILLNEAKTNISRISSHHKSIESFFNRLDSIYIELKDIYDELMNFNDEISFNPDRMQELNERLDSIYRLEKKHNVIGEEELLKIKDQIDNRLLDDNNLNKKLDILKASQKIHLENLTRISKNITHARKQAGDLLAKKILPYFKSLGLKDAELRPEVGISKELNIFGENKIEFMFNANKGGVLSEISKVISGGELSRLMLAIKALEAENKTNNDNNLSLIFDEIDTGVSGDIASKLGGIMKEMSKKYQVIAITHLPQIAAKGDNHFKVRKKIQGDDTISDMIHLNPQQRLEEIGIMLSGEKVTQAAILNARELLS